MRIFGILFLMMLLSACTTPTARPPVALQPLINVEHSTIGNHQDVLVNVVDARDVNSYSTANVTNSQSVSQIMTTQIIDGLNKQGFNATTTASGNAHQLTIKLNTMDYRALSGYVSSNTETFVSAQVSATNGTSTTYTKTYNASAHNDSYMKVSSQTPSAQVNKAFDTLLNNILNDTSLTQFLANSK